MRSSSNLRVSAYRWHNDVHRVCREELLHVQLMFLPVYRREEVFGHLGSLFGERNIIAYHICETYGQYDVLVV